MPPVVSRELLITYGSFDVDSVANASGGNTAYTMVDTAGDGTAPAWMQTNVDITFYNHTNSANDGTFVIQSISGLVVTVNNASGTLEASDSPGLAAFAVAGASDFMMHEKHSKDASYKTRTYSFEVVFSETTEANFENRCTALEQVFRTPRQRLRILTNSVTLDDLNPAAGSGGNTGFHQDPSVEKLADDWDNSRSRHYRVSIQVQLPADLPGQNGRQDSAIQLSFTGNRIARVSLSGRYTALGANDARAQYDAQIATYAAAVFTSLGLSNMELTDETATSDDIDKFLDFSRVYDELIYDQSSGTRDNTSIVRGVYIYTRGQTAPGDSDSNAKRLEDLQVDFRCEVDKSVSTGLESLWTGTVRPYILAQLKSIYSLTQVALVNTNVDVDKSRNTISGRLNVKATASGGGSVVQASESTTMRHNTGKILEPVWDGNAFAKHVYQGAADLIRTVRRTLLVLGGAGGGGSTGPNFANVGGGNVGAGGRLAVKEAGDFMSSVFDDNAAASESALEESALDEDKLEERQDNGESGWVNISDTVTTTPIVLGLSPDQINLLQIDEEIIDHFVSAPTAGSGRPPIASVQN
ncbi:hypothetical protein [uncultured Mediterranean phage]|nr:hypothetical protein [uncultured Mediterranean phage]